MFRLLLRSKHDTRSAHTRSAHVTRATPYHFRAPLSLLLATRTHAQSRKRAAQRQEKHPGQAAKRSNQAAQIFRAPGEEEEEEEEEKTLIRLDSSRYTPTIQNNSKHFLFIIIINYTYNLHVISTLHAYNLCIKYND
mgnify:CR=1 FL=1